jgi:N-acyl-D-aspartate/D-glutamate deacylase
MNMMPLVGHNPLRLSAMDAAAWERPANADEIATMQQLLQASLAAGAWGWSTTASPTHAGPSGEPRRVQEAEGVHHVIVNGQVVLNHGQHTGALPGRVLRSTQQ